MTAFFRPRRGKKATAESQNIVLKRGEVFFESPTGGVGTGIGRIKVGDGTTPYTSLPYFLNPDNFISDISTATVTFTETSETSNSTLFNRIVTGANLNIIVASVKNLLYNIDNSITTMQQNFQAGVDAVYDAVVAKGSTPASHSLSDVVQGIMDIPTGITPSGTKSITANGTGIDVTNYAAVNVAVPASAVVSGNKAITANGTGIDVTNYATCSVAVPNTNTATYTPTSRSDSLDMGATNNYRYVNTNSVPNTNSGTYTYASGSTGGKVDLGATNTYRYVNASNVYSKGVTDGKNAIGPGNMKITARTLGGTGTTQVSDMKGSWNFIWIHNGNAPVWNTSGVSVTTIFNQGEWKLYYVYKSSSYSCSITTTNGGTCGVVMISK